MLERKAPDELLDTYGVEREFAADENILNSTRSTDFITPKSEASRTFRNATLQLARDCGFARQLVNSGRLSKPATLATSPLNTPDEEAFAGVMFPGAALADAPLLRDGAPAWLLEQTGDSFTLLHFGKDAPPEDALRRLAEGEIPVRTVVIAPKDAAQGAGGDKSYIRVEDIEGLAAQRFDAAAGAVYLVRPDQHVCARWRRFDPLRIRAALDRAVAKA